MITLDTYTQEAARYFERNRDRVYRLIFAQGIEGARTTIQVEALGAAGLLQDRTASTMQDRYELRQRCKAFADAVIHIYQHNSLPIKLEIRDGMPGHDAQRLWAALDETRARLRKTARTLVECIGADAPLNADELAERAADEIARLRQTADKWRRFATDLATCDCHGTQSESEHTRQRLHDLERGEGDEGSPPSRDEVNGLHHRLESIAIACGDALGALRFENNEYYTDIAKRCLLAAITLAKSEDKL